MTIQRLALRVMCAVVVLIACARPAAAQWPTVIMFHGGTLKQPVFATGADTPPFGSFVGAPVPNQTITAKDMGDRPYVGVAFFWGPADQPANNGVRTLADLKPEMTWQHGRFYPAAGGKPAMMFMMSMGLVKQVGLTSVMQKRMQLQGAAVPADPAAFNVGREVPAAAMAVLKRLGVPTEAAR